MLFTIEYHTGSLHSVNYMPLKIFSCDFKIFAVVILKNLMNVNTRIKLILVAKI